VTRLGAQLNRRRRGRGVEVSATTCAASSMTASFNRSGQDGINVWNLPSVSILRAASRRALCSTQSPVPDDLTRLLPFSELSSDPSSCSPFICDNFARSLRAAMRPICEVGRDKHMGGGFAEDPAHFTAFTQRDDRGPFHPLDGFPRSTR
jgi:hypothetical protein